MTVWQEICCKNNKNLDIYNKIKLFFAFAKVNLI
jgi:hypothetical protein